MSDNITTSVEAELLRFVLEHFPLARKRNADTKTNLLESGIVDSMGVLDLVAFVEGKYKFTVQDDELVPENFGDVGLVAEFVARNTAQNS